MNFIRGCRGSRIERFRARSHNPACKRGSLNVRFALKATVPLLVWPRMTAPPAGKEFAA